jgi:uncharacterized membrane protein
MAALRDARMLGGGGSIILLLIPIIAFVSLLKGIRELLVVLYFISIVGYILILIAAKYISRVTNERTIFDNVLYAIIFFIIGSTALSMLYIFGTNLVDPFRIFTLTIVVLITLFIFYFLGAIFLRRSFNRIAELVKVNHFKTAALLYLIGAILIIVVIGGVIILIAYIFMIIAFFSLPEQPPTPKPSATIPPPPV